MTDTQLVDSTMLDYHERQQAIEDEYMKQRQTIWDDPSLSPSQREFAITKAWHSRNQALRDTYDEFMRPPTTEAQAAAFTIETATQPVLRRKAKTILAAIEEYLSAATSKRAFNPQWFNFSARVFNPKDENHLKTYVALLEDIAKAGGGYEVTPLADDGILLTWWLYKEPTE